MRLPIAHRTDASASVASLVVALGIVGYPVAAAVASILDMPATGISIGVRLVLFVAAALAFLFALRRLPDVLASGLPMMLILFWTAYSLRLFNDTLLDNPGLSRDVSQYWLFAIGSCLVPMLGVMAARWDRSAGARIVFPLWVGLGFCGIVAVLLGSGQIEDARHGLVNTGRLRLESLNPISLGHVGVSLLIVSIWRLLFPSGRSVVLTTMNVVALLVGAYLLVGASSRGPVLALVVCGAALVATLPRGSRGPAFLVLGASVAAIYRVLVRLSASGEFSTLRRMNIADSIRETGTLGRTDLYEAAIRSFIDNPWLGYRVEQVEYGTYPHNVLIEAFMSLGLFGGLLLTAVVAVSTARAFRLASDRIIGLFGLLYLQYLVAALFSGSLYGSGTFWILTGLMASCAATRQASPGSQERRQKRSRGALGRLAYRPVRSTAAPGASPTGSA